MQKLGESEKLASIFAVAPGLKTDPIGIAIIQVWESYLDVFHVLVSSCVDRFLNIIIDDYRIRL